MKNKIIMSIFAVGLIVLSGFGAAAIQKEKIEIEKPVQTKSIEKTLSFQQPTIAETDMGEYVNVNIKGTDLTFKFPGNPLMPMTAINFQLPFGAKNIEISYIPGNKQVQVITKKIIPTPQIATLSNENVVIDKVLVENSVTYKSAKLYPEKCLDYKITCGLNPNNILVTDVTFYIYPIQYSPLLDEIHYLNDATLEINYDAPESTATFDEEYDLVIIAPQKFSKLLSKLVKHKNDHGTNTFLKTTEEIYDEYSGIDKPEQIKYFIKDAIEKWNITYVLLVGGLKSYMYANDKDDTNQGSTAWHVPVRYTNMPDESTYVSTSGVLSDLYYADVYKAGNEFENWDSNGNGILAEHSDTLDLHPDVYVGRLPCRNRFEVIILINKIIGYEKTSPNSKPWLQRMVTIAGKTFDMYQGMPDGEYVCEVALEYMGDLVQDPIRLYVSNNDTGGPRPIPEDIVEAFTNGAGFINFQGHGNPLRWDTIWADGSYSNHDWAGGTILSDFYKFKNLKKLPIVIIGGCHNGLFNVSVLQTTGPNNASYWTHALPAPVCFSWGMVLVPWGGAIASTGCTGLGIGYVGMPISLSAELESNFFHQVGAGATTVGEAHSSAISKYIYENVLGDTDNFCIVEYQLFADPSLKIGGYE